MGVCRLREERTDRRRDGNGEHESDALEFEFLDPEEPVAARETKRSTRAAKPKPKAKKKAKKR